jgi:hypothetical protein
MTLLQRVEKAENDGIAIRREYSNISTIYFTFQDESIEDMQEIELKRNVKMTYNDGLQQMSITLATDFWNVVIFIWSKKCLVLQQIEMIEEEKCIL